MALSAKSRYWILGVALAATLMAAFAPTESPQPDAPSPVSVAASKPAVIESPAAIDVPSILIARPATTEPASDPFSTSTWLPPPPPSPPVLPATPAPALPYAYLGRIEDAGKTAVLLGQADNSHAVRVGDVLGAAWRVERITDQAIDFIYLPLDVRKSLPTGRDS